MIKAGLKIVWALAILLAGGSMAAQSRWNHLDREKAVSMDSLTKKGFTLILLNNSTTFDSAVGKRLVEVFFKVYPKEARIYNRETLRKVFFIIDTGYKGVAAASAGIVRFNPKWFESHPKDVDVVTHEVMHIVQNYGDGAGPGWLTEGIADYVRHTLGVDNAGAGWSLPAFKATQSYTNAYRVTARFLVWIEKHHRKGFVKKVDAALRLHTYTPKIWAQLTGKTVDELWSEYALNPAI